MAIESASSPRPGHLILSLQRKSLILIVAPVDPIDITRWADYGDLGGGYEYHRGNVGLFSGGGTEPGIICSMEPDLKVVVERLHRCEAMFIEEVFVVERFGVEVVWSGCVSVFDLKGHPKAVRAYAWSSPMGGSKKRRHRSVLHVPPVDSPQAAVRASIAQDRRVREPGW